MSMTVDEVSGRLRVSRWVVSRACQAGHLPGATHDGARSAWSIPPAAIAAFVAARTFGGTDPKDIPVDELPRFYTLAEVAEQTSLPLRWLARQVQAGKVRYCRIGRTPMMTADQIAALAPSTELRTAADAEVEAERQYRENRRGRRRSSTPKAA